MAMQATNTMRLTFLYPHLFRRVSARHCDQTLPVRASARRCDQTLPIRSGIASLHTSTRSAQQQQQDPQSRPSQDSFTTRVGSAVPPTSTAKNPKDDKPATETSAQKSKAKKHTDPVPSKDKDRQKAASAASKGTTAEKDSKNSSSPPAASTSLSPPDPSLPATQPKALETVLHLDPPSSSSTSTSPPPSSSSSSSTTSPTSDHPKPPHLQATPYIHHFDTYTLVRDLERGGFTEPQSVTTMKAVRALLADNLDVARAGLVSKSDVENETYLFRAACSELRTDLLNARASTTTKMRAERAQLQHEVDILNQKMTQESLTLKDALRGGFDDRKMAVRMEQRELESKIQELNYQITVRLGGEAREGVEGLRWVLTRRAALAIGVMAFLILGSLRYTTYQMHLQDVASRPATKKSKESRDAGNQTSEGESPMAGTGGETEMLASASLRGSTRGGADPSYVSLG